MEKDPRIDAYIDRQADFAKPILNHLREVMHAACPDCQEDLKWSAPAFLYKGKILGSMAAFKAHAAFGFHQGKQVVETGEKAASAMGQMGRLTSIDDLPPRDEFIALVRKAMELTDAGVKAPRAKHARPALEMPADLAEAISANEAASATFEAFPPGARRDYIEWIIEAKREETRAKRIAQAVTWMAEGKKRHWKYEKC